MDSTTLAMVLGGVILALAAMRFALFCLDDIARRDVRYLSKPVWSLIVCLSLPLGGMFYFLIERDSPRL